MVGEDHTDSKNRADIEKLYSYEKTKSSHFWWESEFSIQVPDHSSEKAENTTIIGDPVELKRQHWIEEIKEKMDVSLMYMETGKDLNELSSKDRKILTILASIDLIKESYNSANSAPQSVHNLNDSILTLITYASKYAELGISISQDLENVVNTIAEVYENNVKPIILEVMKATGIAADEIEKTTMVGQPADKLIKLPATMRRSLYMVRVANAGNAAGARGTWKVGEDHIDDVIKKKDYITDILGSDEWLNDLEGPSIVTQEEFDQEIEAYKEEENKQDKHLDALRNELVEVADILFNIDETSEIVKECDNLTYEWGSQEEGSLWARSSLREEWKPKIEDRQAYLEAVESWERDVHDVLIRAKGENQPDPRADEHGQEGEVQEGNEGLERFKQAIQCYKEKTEADAGLPSKDGKKRRNRRKLKKAFQDLTATEKDTVRESKIYKELFQDAGIKPVMLF